LLWGQSGKALHTAQTASGIEAARPWLRLSGNWLVDIGLSGKGGIGGRIVTVSPGKGDWLHSLRCARCWAYRPSFFPNDREWICSSRTLKRNVSFCLNHLSELAPQPTISYSF
jgi:hypothetical protein